MNKVIDELDMFINVVDEWHYKYVVDQFDYTYQLHFTFEDWTNIYGGNERHISYVAEYISHTGMILVKFQNDNFEVLCEKVKEWNTTHRIGFKKRHNFEPQRLVEQYENINN